ncbi:hypothetical protein SAMN02910317_01002 [Ruminococcaceae bacterium FB2012]|nr:hypothetical protein SAMN02910317_01002 [Ruminococcaceae bacterium FB2012]
MNDRELMKKIYDGRCADEMSAAEILEGSAEPARVRSKAPVIAAAAAAAVLAVGTAVFLKYKAAPVKPSGDGGESVTAADSVSGSSDTSADTSADPWEPYAVSMPDPFIRTDASDESRDVIELMDSSESDPPSGGLSEKEREALRRFENQDSKYPLPEYIKGISGLDFTRAAVYNAVVTEDAVRAKDTAELKALSRGRVCLLPAADGTLISVEFDRSGNLEAVGTPEASVPGEIESLLRRADAYGGSQGGVSLFCITDAENFDALLCFDGRDGERAMLYRSVKEPQGAGFIDEYPLEGQAYPFEHINVWAGRKHRFMHSAVNSVVYCDFDTGTERLEMISGEQLDKLTEWYKVHEADAVNVPADGSQGDNRFIKCKGAAYAGFAVDGGYAVISRAYGSEDSVKGINVTVTDENGSASVRWYADGPDTEGITALFDSLFGE